MERCWERESSTCRQCKIMKSMNFSALISLKFWKKNVKSTEPIKISPGKAHITFSNLMRIFLSVSIHFITRTFAFLSWNFLLFHAVVWISYVAHFFSALQGANGTVLLSSIKSRGRREKGTRICRKVETVYTLNRESIEVPSFRVSLDSFSISKSFQRLV